MSEPDPTAIASALIEYRVTRLEEALIDVRKEQTAQGRKLDDIPGLLQRKFDEQALNISANRKTAREWLIQILTIVIATVSAVAAVSVAVAHTHA